MAYEIGKRYVIKNIRHGIWLPFKGLVIGLEVEIVGVHREYDPGDAIYYVKFLYPTPALLESATYQANTRDYPGTMMLNPVLEPVVPSATQEELDAWDAYDMEETP